MADLTNDPALVRSDRRIRLGGFLPFLAVFPTLVVLRIMRCGAGSLAVSVGILVAIGQGLVWIGVLGLRNSRDWASGTLFHLILGGVLSALALFLTGVPALMLIPLVAPVVATFARWRSRRVGAAP